MRPGAIRRGIILVGLAVGATAHGRASAQSNLQVLPDTLTRRQLTPIMREMADGLGVNCAYCHVMTDPSDMRSFDYALDDKPEKRIAREMLRMVADINSERIPRAVAERPDGSDPVEVTCATCHRSNARPVFIEDVIALRLEEQGIESAIAHYRELRGRYFGGYEYDFRAGPLTSLAQSLSGEGRFDEALAFAGLAVEYYPEDSDTLFTLGQIQERAGHTDRAIETMTRALELAPEDRKAFFQRQIDRLRGGADAGAHEEPPTGIERLDRRAR
jgi:tetratricopeptide (TPR) repeat protein